MLGLYVSGNPLDKFKDKLERLKQKSAILKALPGNMPLVSNRNDKNGEKNKHEKRRPDDLYEIIRLRRNSIENVIFPKIF